MTQWHIRRRMHEPPRLMRRVVAADSCCPLPTRAMGPHLQFNAYSTGALESFK